MASDIKVNILTGFNDKGVKEAIANLKGLGDGFRNIAKQLIGSYVGFQGFQKGVDFIRGSVDASRDLQRNMAGLQTIFGESTPIMKKFAETGVEMGMSTAEAAKATTFIGSVMKQSGFAMKDNIYYTKELVSLGADLAATYGYDVQEALTGMTALFRGEYDPIEKFGVAIKQAQVNTLLAENGMSKLTGTQKLQAQQLARMVLLFKATADVQGAFGRQTNTLAVSQQQLAATWTNLKASLGDALIGPMTSLVILMRSLTDTIGPALGVLFESIAGLFGIVGSNASEVTGQIVKLIEQITALVNVAAPILGVIIKLMSIFGASIVTAVIAFKTIHTVITGFGTAVVAFNTIITAYTARQVAAAEATVALAAAEEGAIVPTATLGATMAATPWGAIAVAIGLVVAGIVGVSVFASSAKTDTEKLGGAVKGASGYFQAGRGDVEAYGGSARAAAYKMDELAAATTRAARAAGTLPQKADNSDIFNRKQVGKIKQSPAVTPLTQAEKDLAAFKKTMGAITGAIGGSGSKAKSAAKTAKDAAAKAAKEAAKAAADAAEAGRKAFADQVTAIQGEMEKLHDSIVGAFDITNMGKSGGSISRNIDKFMVKLRQFAGYIAQLRASGLNENLLTQLAMAGPESGLAAAKAFAGSPQLVAQANAAYGELGTTASAIAGSVVQAQAAPVYNVTVNGGLDSSASIGKAVVTAIQAFERQSGPSWRTK